MKLMLTIFICTLFTVTTTQAQEVCGASPKEVRQLARELGKSAHSSYHSNERTYRKAHGDLNRAKAGNLGRSFVQAYTIGLSALIAGAATTTKAAAALSPPHTIINVSLMQMEVGAQGAGMVLLGTDVNYRIYQVGSDDDDQFCMNRKGFLDSISVLSFCRNVIETFKSSSATKRVKGLSSEKLSQIFEQNPQFNSSNFSSKDDQSFESLAQNLQKGVLEALEKNRNDFKNARKTRTNVDKSFAKFLAVRAQIFNSLKHALDKSLKIALAQYPRDKKMKSYITAAHQRQASLLLRPILDKERNTLPSIAKSVRSLCKGEAAKTDSDKTNSPTEEAEDTSDQ